MDLDIFTSRDQCSPTLLLNDSQYFDKEFYDELKTDVEEQFIHFGDLGINKLKDVNYIYKTRLYNDFIEYSINTYMTISNYEDIKFSTNKLMKVGDLLYNFICIDCYNMLIPNYLETINVYDLASFDNYFKTNLHSDPLMFRNSFVGIIVSIWNRFNNLIKLFQDIKNDPTHKMYRERLSFYIELINFCDADLFLNGYFRPVLDKNGTDLIWRIT